MSDEHFNAVRDWEKIVAEDGTYELPEDEAVLAVLLQVMEIIAEDDERGPDAWDAICDLVREYGPSPRD